MSIMVTVCAALTVPTCGGGKVTLAGVKAAAAPAVGEILTSIALDGGCTAWVATSDTLKQVPD